MKKSKVIIPALGVLVLSTAASVTGTVAWFTANRTYKMFAGDFAVVNTKNNMEAVLTAGVATAANDNVISLADADNTLTDASFNHITNDIIEPDDNGTCLDDIIALGSANGTNLLREGKVFSAFTWDVTFKMSFSSNATQDIGLYIDMSTSWVHVQYIAKAGDVSDGAYFTDKECTEANKVSNETALTADQTYWRKQPLSTVGSLYTAHGFRMAFVPKTIPTGSLGFTKVWAPFQTAANCDYINDSTILEFDAEEDYTVGQVVKHSGDVYKCKTAGAHSWSAENWEQTALLDAYDGNGYSNSTMQLVNGTWTSATAGSAQAPKVLMDSAYTPVSPLATDSKANNLSDDAAYLGYFGKAPGGVTELTFTCVVWFEGTDPTIKTTSTTVYETVSSYLEFTSIALSD